MKIYLDKNVFEQSLDRFRFIYDEFEHVTICFSGGKDSTVCLELAIQVAKEKNRLPVNVMFVDQEAEWQAVVDYVKETMYRKEVKPYWLQIPIVLYNATSETTNWLDCWGEGKNWVHPKDPIAITENRYGTNRFKKMFESFLKVEFDNKCGTKACLVGGVRAEESPGRALSLTTQLKYKHVTWGKAPNKQLTFYPIYDWKTHDVWKAIDHNKWNYCKIYDKMYSHGVAVQKMRVSNVHHETAVESLFMMQELEPETWERLTARMSGINTAKQLSENWFPKELPYMFQNWIEYRDYLLGKFVVKEDYRKKFLAKFKILDSVYSHDQIKTKMAKECISSILTLDYEFIKIGNFEVRQETAMYSQWKSGKLKADHPLVRSNKYVVSAIKQDKND